MAPVTPKNKVSSVVKKETTKGTLLGTPNREPQEYSRNIMEYKDPGRYIPVIYLLYSWGSRFGVPSRVPLTTATAHFSHFMPQAVKPTDQKSCAKVIDTWHATVCRMKNYEAWRIHSPRRPNIP